MSRRRSRFLIWGAGGHGRVVADLIRSCGHELVGFVDSDPSKRGEVVEPGGARVVRDEAEFLADLAAGNGFPDGFDRVALAVGDNRVRLLLLDQLGPLCAPALLHPSAVVSASASVADGSVVFPAAVVNAGARIAEAVIVNSGAVIEHDCRLAAGVHVSPNATLTGNVEVGERSWIGAGATVLPGLTIGADAMVGAGAVVVRSVPAGSTVVGGRAASIHR